MGEQGKSMIIRFAAASVACVAMLALAGCAGGGAEQTEAPTSADANAVVIGVAGPMTGRLASFGKEARLGAETAVDRINAAGGVLGKNLRLLDGDDGCDAKRAVDVASDLVRQRAVFVVGHFCSGASIPAYPVYAAAGVVQMTPASTNPVLTDQAAENGDHTVFRTTNRDEGQGSFAGAWLAKNYGGKKLAVLDDGTPYGLRVSERVIESAAAGGLTPALRYTYMREVEDFSEIVGKLAAEKIDVVYVGGFPEDIGWLVKQARSQGFQAQFLGGDTMNNKTLWNLAGEAASGFMFTDAAVLSDDPAAKAAVAALRANGDASDRYNLNHALNAYAAVEAFAAAAKATGSTDGKTVAAWLHQNAVPTAVGTLRWDEKGDLTEPRFAWFVWRNGDFSPAPQ
jgi:branched-chain amino acid transport system substrate-binding protein